LTPAIDNGVDGKALVHLDHDELRDVGIKSVGHRLTILKNVYNIKIAHGVPIEPEHYVPVCMLRFLLSYPQGCAYWVSFCGFYSRYPILRWMLIGGSLCYAGVFSRRCGR
jgi:hypothetical protein